jgi:hypothetical protein
MFQLPHAPPLLATGLPWAGRQRRPAAPTRPFWRAALLALVLWPCLHSGAQATRCPSPPRDWTPKTLDAFGEGGAIWKLNDPAIDTDKLAAALKGAYGAIYHDPTVVPEPPFLERFHDPVNWREGASVNPNTFDYLAQGAYRQDAELARLGKDLQAGWSWGPNPAHSSYDVFKFHDEANRKSAKCRSDGLVLIGYYKWINSMGVARTAPAINDARKDPQYIVSIMDLTKAHLPWLKSMRTQALAWVKDVYDVKPAEDGDTVRMYFHWPTGHPTSTLHMHVRVNWRMSPVEYIHSYMLDDVIQALESGKTVAQMIADRYKRLGGVVIDGAFEKMTEPGTPAGLLNRYLQSVRADGTRVFNDAKELPEEAFGSVKNILRTALVVDDGATYYVQRSDKDEKSKNLVRVDKLDRRLKWVPTSQGVFTAKEIEELGLQNYRGTLQGLLGCLLPYFDNATSNDCVKINADGSNLERYPSLDEFKAAMVCPAAHTCYAARVERSLNVNGQFRLWITDADWNTLRVVKGIDPRKIDFKGYVDGIQSADTAFEVRDIGGTSIVNGTPARERDLTRLSKEYAQDEKIIAKWVGRFAMLALPPGK